MIGSPCLIDDQEASHFSNASKIVEFARMPWRQRKDSLHPKPFLFWQISARILAIVEAAVQSLER